MKQDIQHIQIQDIDWGDRSRKDYGDVQELADSIEKLGLINPITLGDGNILLAGGRRLSAMMLLEKKTIPFIAFSSLSEDQKLDIELEENIKRKDFTWQEESALKARIDKLKKKLNPEWSAIDTAKLFGVSERHLRSEIELAKAVELFPEIKEEKDKNSARTKLRRIKDNAKRSVDVAKVEIPAGLHHGDTTKILPTLPDESVDLILFDPPFAVNFGERNWSDNYHTTYGELKDDLENVLPAVLATLKESYRLMKEGSHGYMFFALRPENYLAYHEAIIQSGLKTLGIPLFWVKTSNFNPRPYSKFTLNYEPFFHFWKGGSPRDLQNESKSTFHYDIIKTQQKQHPAEKPIDLYKNLINLSSIPGETVLDPMMGSGISLCAAKSLGRNIIGVEKEKEWFELATLNIKKGGE